MRCQTHSTLIDHINESLKQLDEQITAILPRPDPVLPEALALLCAQQVLSLSHWCANPELLRDAMLFTQLLETLTRAQHSLQPDLLKAFFSIQMRINDTPGTELYWYCQRLLEQAVTSHTVSVVAEQAGKQAPGINTEQQGLLKEFCSGIKSSRQAQALLQQQLEALLLNIAELCLHSNWSPDYFMSSNLSHLCTLALGLSEFSADQACKAGLNTLSQAILLRHLWQQKPAPEVLQVILHGVFSLALQGKTTDRFKLLPATGLQLSLDENTDRMIRAELFSYATSLARTIQSLTDSNSTSKAAQQHKGSAGYVLVNENMLLISYKLSWVLQAYACHGLANLNTALYQLYLQCWSLRIPLPAEVLPVAQSFNELLLEQAEAALPKNSEAELMVLIRRLLACWPQAQTDTTLMLTPGVSAVNASGTLSLEQVPQYLSSAFSALLAVSARHFETQNFPDINDQDIQNELRLLERGAAVFKLDAMERACTVMLDIYQVLELFKAGYLPGLILPGALLWQAHQQLIGMLDQAAAWLEPVSRPLLISALTDWLAQADACIAHESKPHSGMNTVQSLVLALTTLVRQMSILLGRSLRLKVSLADELPGCLLQELVLILSEVLKWLLLQAGSDMETRREKHKPLALNIQVTVAALTAQYFQLEVSDDSCANLPGPKQIHRLRKKTGAALQNLKCTVQAGEGRLLCFSLRAPE